MMLTYGDRVRDIFAENQSTHLWSLETWRIKHILKLRIPLTNSWVYHRYLLGHCTWTQIKRQFIMEDWLWVCCSFTMEEQFPSRRHSSRRKEVFLLFYLDVFVIVSWDDYICELHAASKMDRLLSCPPEVMHAICVQPCVMRKTLFQVFIYTQPPQYMTACVHITWTVFLNIYNYL